MPVKYIIFLCLFSASVFLTGCTTTTYSDPDSDFEVSLQFKKENDRSLFYAVKNSSLTDADYYLSKKANPNVCDNMGQTALMWACWNGNVRVVETLFENKKGFFTPKVNTNAVNIFGYNALFCAAYAGKFDIIKILINYNADLFNKGKTEITEEGTKKYPDTLITDNSGENILHKIVKSNNFEAFKSFLTYCSKQKIHFNEKPFLDALINEKNKEGYTPLHFAVLKKNPDMVNLLLKSGANPNEAAKIGDSTIAPLYSAYNERDYPVFVELLCSESIDLKVNSLQKANKQYTSQEQYISLETLMKNDNDYGKSKKYFIESFNSRKEYSEKNLEDKGITIRQKVISKEYEKMLKNFYGMVKENRDLNEIKQLGDQINSLNFGDVDKLEQKKLFELAVENKNRELFEYLLEVRVNYQNYNYSNDILQYVLNSKTDDIQWKTNLIVFLILNANKYKGKYNTDLQDKETGEYVHMKLLDNKEIRETLSWGELKDMVDILGRKIDIVKVSTNSGENIFNYICAKNRSEYKWHNELFDYMLQKVSFKIIVGRRRKPLLNYLFEEEYYYGVEKILKMKRYCERLEVESATSDDDEMRFYEVLLQALENAGNTQEQIARIARYTEIYLDYYPNDRPVTENLW